jgi:hypothetical protein
VAALVVGSATLVVGMPAAAAPVGQITELSSRLTYAIAPGADGNMWFTDEGGAIGRIITSGQIAEFSSGLNPGSVPNAIAPGADGNLWFTDDGSTKAIGRITPSGQIAEFSSGLNPGGVPSGIGIAPGADGNLWFTDDGSTKAIGRITTSGQIAEFSSGLNPGSVPLGIAPGADGNLWFTDGGSTTAIGQIGAGAPAASVAGPAVAGSHLAGAQQLCDGGLWASWSGPQPSSSAFSFDGYQWLLDGSPLVGQTGQSYTPTSTQVGHGLSCQVTVTYPLPLLVTTAATSGQVTVAAPSQAPRSAPSRAPSPPRVKLTKAKISAKHHTATFSFKALGTASGFQCALVKRTRHKPGPRPRFESCKSPQRYKRLKPGNYTFEVRALTTVGHGTLATKSFKIG